MKINLAALCRTHSVAKQTLHKLIAEGVDLSDEKALLEGLASSRARREKADTSAIAAAGIIPAGSESYAAARLRKEIATANLTEAKAKIATGDSLEMEHVMDLFTSIGAEMRSRLMALVGTLPPMLEGLDATRIQTILRIKIIEVLAVIEKHNLEKL